METSFARLLTQQARIARIVWVTTSSIRLYLRDHIPAHIYNLSHQYIKSFVEYTKSVTTTVSVIISFYVPYPCIILLLRCNKKVASQSVPPV